MAGGLSIGASHRIVLCRIAWHRVAFNPIEPIEPNRFALAAVWHGGLRRIAMIVEQTASRRMLGGYCHDVVEACGSIAPM